MDDLTQPHDQNPTIEFFPHKNYMQGDLTQPAERVQVPIAQAQATRVFIPPPAPKIGPPANRRVTQLPAKTPVRKNANWPYVLIALGVVGFALVFSLSAILLRRAADARAEQPTGQIEPTNVFASVVEDATATPLPPTPTQGLTIQPWDGQQRFTMLVMGIDKRPGESGTAFRTDTLIIVSIDPVTHSIGMLSVPRDLYVSIPPNTVVGNSYGLQRVNAAYVIGESVKPGYGPQLTMQTVQYNLGIRINDYVVVDFNAVVEAVNAVNGIDIDVPAAISDPAYPNMNYGYDPLYIPAGHIHMDGNLALKYARTRHQSSDLDRARRQQQVITAIRDKILSVDMVPRLVAQAPLLWSQFSSDVHTDLTLDQLLRLGLYVKDVPKSNIHQGVIDYSYVTSQMWQGMAILVPNRAAIGPLMVQVFGANYNS